MISSAINSRLKRLERQQRTDSGSDTIMYLSSGSWLVLKNHTDYKTLEQALNSTRSTNVKVDDSRLIISKLSEAEVKKLTKAAKLKQKDHIFNKLKQPSKELAQVILKYPDINFKKTIANLEE